MSDTTPSISADTRTLIGKQSRQLRNQGKIPAVVYGFKQESQPITLDAASFTKIYQEVGTTTLVELKLDAHKGQKVLIHSVQVHPTKQILLHVDLYKVNMKEKLRTTVPLEFIGNSPLIDVEGGSLMVVKDEIEVECLPDDLIQEIQVDISTLQSFEDSVRVKDLIIPATITILNEDEEMIASVNEPRSEEELAELDAPVEDTTAEVESEHQSGTDQPKPEEEKAE